MADFYDSFFLECEKYFNICKGVEEELFPEIINFNRNEKITLNHYEDTSVFLRKVEEKIGEEIDRNEQIFNDRRFHEGFCNRIAKKQIFIMNKYLNNVKEIDNEESKFIRHYIFSINFLPIKAVRSEKKKGLKLPSYNIKTVKGKERIQEYYEAKEMFRILTSYESMIRRNEVTNSKIFFNTYIKNLVNRYINTIGGDSKKINNIIKNIKKIIYANKNEINDEDKINSFIDYLKEGYIFDAHEEYLLFKNELNDTIKNKIDTYFLKLYKYYHMNNEKIKNDDTDVISYRSDEQNIMNNNYISEYIDLGICTEELSEKINRDKDKIEALIKKYTKCSNKENICQDTAIEIKQKLILALLTEPSIDKDKINTIKRELCRSYKNSHNELMHLHIELGKKTKKSPLEVYKGYLGSFFKEVSKDENLDTNYKETVLDAIEMKIHILESLRR